MNHDTPLNPFSGSREIQMHTDALVRLDGPIDTSCPRDHAESARACQTFEPETGDDDVWRPPLFIVLSAIPVWIWIVFEAYQMVHRAPGLFE